MPYRRRFPYRRCFPAAFFFSNNMDSDSYESDVSVQMQCHSCEAYYDRRESGTCKECYEEAKDTEEALRCQIDDLLTTVEFLKLLPPSDHAVRFVPAASTAADVYLVAVDDVSAPKGGRVPAHRAMLVSRSPVFRAMLENDMEESRSGTIKITDVTYDCLRAFVNYLYTSDSCLSDEMARNLLVMAEKYEVKHLKTHCEKFLISTLKPEKSLVHFAFAHRHNAKRLKNASLAVVLENMEMISKSDEYKELVQSDTLLVVDIYESYLGKRLNTGASLNSCFRNI